MTNKKSKGLFIGKSHKEGGIPSKVKETGQLLEIEGFEYYICNSAYNSNDKYHFEEKTNREILNKIYTDKSCELNQSIMSSGDFIVCKLVTKDSKKRNRSGTIKEIVNQMQSEKSCKVENRNSKLKSGGEITQNKIKNAANVNSLAASNINGWFKDGLSFLNW